MPLQEYRDCTAGNSHVPHCSKKYKPHSYCINMYISHELQKPGATRKGKHSTSREGTSFSIKLAHAFVNWFLYYFSVFCTQTGFSPRRTYVTSETDIYVVSLKFEARSLDDLPDVSYLMDCHCVQRSAAYILARGRSYDIDKKVVIYLQPEVLDCTRERFHRQSAWKKHWCIESVGT